MIIFKQKIAELKKNNGYDTIISPTVEIISGCGKELYD